MGIVLNYSPVSYNVKSPLKLTFFINLGVIHKQHVIEKKSKEVSRIQMHRLIFASVRPKFAHVGLGARRYENWAKSRTCPLRMWLRYRWVTLQLPDARYTFIAGLSVLHFKNKFLLGWCQMSRFGARFGAFTPNNCERIYSTIRCYPLAPALRKESSL